MMKYSPMVDELRRDVHMLGVVGATGKAKIVQSEFDVLLTMVESLVARWTTLKQ